MFVCFTCRENCCFPTRLAYIQVTNHLLSYTTDQSGESRLLSGFVHHQAEKELTDINQNDLFQPGAAGFFQSLAFIYLRQLLKCNSSAEAGQDLAAWVKILLRSPLYEVRLSALDILVGVLDSQDKEAVETPCKTESSKEEELQKCIMTDDTLRELVAMAEGREQHAECLVQVSHNVLNIVLL